MYEKHKNGQSWFSHRLDDGGWCKGEKVSCSLAHVSGWPTFLPRGWLMSAQLWFGLARLQLLECGRYVLRRAMELAEAQTHDTCRIGFLPLAIDALRAVADLSGLTAPPPEAQEPKIGDLVRELFRMVQAGEGPEVPSAPLPPARDAPASHPETDAD